MFALLELFELKNIALVAKCLDFIGTNVSFHFNHFSLHRTPQSEQHPEIAKDVGVIASPATTDQQGDMVKAKTQRINI